MSTVANKLMLGTSDLPSLYGYIIDVGGTQLDRVQSLSNGELVVALNGRLLKLDADDFSEQWEVSNTSSFQDTVGLVVDSNNYIYYLAQRDSGGSSYIHITKHNPADGSQETYKRYIGVSGITFDHNAVWDTCVLREGADSAIAVRTSTVDAIFLSIDIEGGDTGIDDRSVEYGGGAGFVTGLADRGDNYISQCGRDQTSGNIFAGYCLTNGTINYHRTIQYQISSVDKISNYASIVSDGSSRVYVSSLVDSNYYTTLSKFDFNMQTHYETIAYNFSGGSNKPVMVMDDAAEYIYLAIHDGSYKYYFVKIDLSDMSIAWEFSIRNTTSDYSLSCSYGCIKQDDGAIVFGFSNGLIILSPDGLPTGTFGDFEVVAESNGLKSDLTFDSFTTESSTVAHVTGSNNDIGFENWSDTSVITVTEKQEIKL